MAVNWTNEQRQVIELSDRDILVSAAAGSGKTAVLVERIIGKVTNTRKPVDIDRLLVVTFTNAAAAEMRERIRLAIEKRLEAEPENELLMRQSALIHNAQITTIDSFCLFVVRNHFGEIGLDPNFRIADPGELALLEIDTLGELFEKEYEAADEASSFLKLIDAYSKKRSDQAVKDMVAAIYHQSLSMPWPKEWITSLLDNYSCSTLQELLKNPIIVGIATYIKRLTEDLASVTTEMLGLANAQDGPSNYAKALESDLAFYESIMQQPDLLALQECITNHKFDNLASIRNFDGDEGKKLRVMEGRKACKELMEDIKKKYFLTSFDEVVKQLGRQKPFVEELVRLSLLYADAMALKKKKKRIVDFSDIEHFALNILVDEQTKEVSATAAEFQRQFEEVMIDEYQDSNQVQEEIMLAVAKNSCGGHNMFMVGDVKQSIYRFRMACPRLFMDKYEAFSLTESKSQRIDLHKNFRSRDEVVDFANDIFYKLMSKDLGDVGYDEEAALYRGATYEENKNMNAEICYFDLSDVQSEDHSLEEMSKQQLEARMVAKRIKELMETTQVTDKETGHLRPLHYRDIVILFRSIRGWGENFADVLSECGIPVHVESQTGYFSAIEVQTVLNMLRILDNPYQDIPMAAVLHSPIAGLDNEELAEVSISEAAMPFSYVVLTKMKQAHEIKENQGEDELTPAEQKLARFYGIYEKLRQNKELAISEFIHLVLTETGYKDYVSALPAGQKRAANLNMLLEKARAYEATSYKGLFHFVRFIDLMKKYEIDSGEADVTGENADVVHIMTIHKSKGLEFPVVFVSGLSKKFNMADTTATMVLHSDYGLGLSEITAIPRMKRECLLRSEIAEQMKQESLGEELRVLYVALTRAKEKLILTGTIESVEKLSEYRGNVLERQALSFLTRVKAKSYTDWIIPAALSYPDKYQISFVGGKELIEDEMVVQSQKSITYEALKNEIAHADETCIAQMQEAFSYTYPFANERNVKSKYSVSELKHASMDAVYGQAEQEAEKPRFLMSEKEAYIPAFAKSAEEAPSVFGVNPGALRGTAVHRVMECLDFVKLSTIDNKDRGQIKAFVSEELERMKRQNELSEEMERLVHPSIIEQFVGSDVANRMAKAAACGKLYKEKPFVMQHDTYLVQGIIDVFWEEEDSLVVLDYKTDHVQEAKELVLRYKTQLELYGEALARIFSTEDQKYQVKEQLIYSFKLKEVVKL